MPLPTALLQKLQKRGIVGPKGISKGKKKDYKGYQFCPNKYNVFHTCTLWCENIWKGHITPDPVYVRSIQKLLLKYPLPHNWTEIFDKAVGRYYYWNMENDLVSWLPPKHPLSKPSKSASKIREELNTNKKEEKSQIEKVSDDFKKPFSRHKRDSDKDDRYRKEDRDKYSSKRKRPDILDPMDPASYSDIAPGTWSDGLDNNKSNADNTASGVLYQQRPYPSPGEVLSSNKDKHRDKKH